MDLREGDYKIPEGQGLVCRRGVWARVALTPRGAAPVVKKKVEKIEKPETEALEDLRTLWVDHDSHGKRWKEWKAVCHECSEDVAEDAPLDGPGSTLHLMRYMERFGGNPRLWLDTWSRDVSLHKSDRTYHELSVLTEVMLIGGSFDQINLSALQSFEKVARRVQIIIEAHRPGQAPQWQMAKYLGGDSSLGDGVSPALRSYGSWRAREDFEVQSARSRVLGGGKKGGFDEEAGGDGGDAGGGATDDSRGPSRGRGRGRGK